MQLPERFSDLPEHVFSRPRRLPAGAPMHALRRDARHPQGHCPWGSAGRAEPDAPDDLAYGVASIRDRPTAGVQE